MAVKALAPGVVKVILDGRLDIAGTSVTDLQFSAIAGAYKAVVVDLARVSFLASIGIRTLLLGAKAVQRRGGTLILLNPVAEVERVLEVGGLGIKLMRGFAGSIVYQRSGHTNRLLMSFPVG